MTAPRDFFDTMVKPAYEAWCAEPLAEWAAKAAVGYADTLAERVFVYWEATDRSKVAGAFKVRQYRDYLRAKYPDFGLVWDVHDGVKHFKLDRNGREVTSATQTGIGRMGYGEGLFGEGEYGGAKQIVIELDDGSKRTLAGVMHTVMAMWEAELAAMGL